MVDDYSFKANIDVNVNGKQAASDIHKVTEELQFLRQEILKNNNVQKSSNKLQQISSRDYANASVLYDAAIQQRQRDSATFSASLKGRLQLQQQEINQLPRLSYALYDISRTAALMAGAVTAAGVASLKMAADFETAFTAVERTTLSTGQTLDLLREQLLSLSTQVPISFTGLSEIAAIGAQLGITTGDLAGFTKNVSMFSATTNVSIEETAKSFGALGELLGVASEDYNKLGSAISFVGVRSVATESEILSVAKNLGGIANQANLSAEFVIGLSGALASLRVPAEQSRGALTRVFQEINRSAIEGGPKLQAFADVLGVTVQQAQELAQTDQQQFFQNLLQGLSSLDSGQLTAALDAMNLSDIRVTNTLTRLSKNLNVVNSSLDDSQKAYKNGTFLAQAYGYKVDDLASRFTIFQNSLMEVGAAFGEAISPAVADILDLISKSLNGLADALRTDAGQAFIQITTPVLGFVAALSGIVAVGSLVIATQARMATAVATLGWAESANSIKAYIASLYGVGAASASATTAVKVFKVALISTGIGLAVVALGSLVAAFQETANSADDTFNRFISDTSGLSDAVQADIDGYRAARIAGDQEAVASYIAIQGATEGASQDQLDYQASLRDTANILGVEVPLAFQATNDAIVGNTRFLGENTQEWISNSLATSDAFRELLSSGVVYGGEKVSDVLKTLRFDFDEFTQAVARGQGETYLLGLANAALVAGRITQAQFKIIKASIEEGGFALNSLIGLVQGYVNVISFLEIPGTTGASVDALNESFVDLGDSVGGAAKQVYTLVDYANDLASVFKRAFDVRWKSALAADDLVDAWESLSQRIDDARNRILGLTNTRDRLEYFLSIAVAAGDTLRINELQAELAANAKELADAEGEASTELTGNSKAARRNRKELTDLLNTNADYITSLAESGASVEFMNSEVARLNDEFTAQGLALGYSQADLQQYTASFSDLTTILNRVPRNITVDANADPALQALNEFIAKANASSGTVTLNTKVNGDQTAATRSYLQALYDSKKALHLQQLAIRNYSGAILSADAMAAYAAQIRALGGTVYSSGGYTGAGGKYEPAGIVHKGEYVVPKSMVNQSTGLPYADALGRLMPSSAPNTSSYANGGLVGGAMMVSLSPEDRAILRQVGASGDIVVAVDSREIARANSRGAKLVTAEGGFL